MTRGVRIDIIVYAPNCSTAINEPSGSDSAPDIVVNIPPSCDINTCPSSETTTSHANTPPSLPSDIPPSESATDTEESADWSSNYFTDPDANNTHATAQYLHIFHEQLFNTKNEMPDQPDEQDEQGESGSVDPDIGSDPVTGASQNLLEAEPDSP